MEVLTGKSWPLSQRLYSPLILALPKWPSWHGQDLRKNLTRPLPTAPTRHPPTRSATPKTCVYPAALLKSPTAISNLWLPAFSLALLPLTTHPTSVLFHHNIIQCLLAFSQRNLHHHLIVAAAVLLTRIVSILAVSDVIQHPSAHYHATPLGGIQRCFPPRASGRTLVLSSSACPLAQSPLDSPCRA